MSGSKKVLVGIILGADLLFTLTEEKDLQHFDENLK